MNSLHRKLQFQLIQSKKTEEETDLSITSTVSADTPTDYVHHTDVSISSTVSADTPTNI